MYRIRLDNQGCQRLARFNLIVRAFGNPNGSWLGCERGGQDGICEINILSGAMINGEAGGRPRCPRMASGCEINHRPGLVRRARASRFPKQDRRQGEFGLAHLSVTHHVSVPTIGPSNEDASFSVPTSRHYGELKVPCLPPQPPRYLHLSWINQDQGRGSAQV